MTENDARQLSEWNRRVESEPRIRLWEAGKAPGSEGAEGQREPSITAFLPENGGRSAMLVCVGGGFVIKAPHEGWPVCEWLNANGIAAFLLDYRISPCFLPAIVGEAKRAMRLIRHLSAGWGLDPDKIGILGFSAGGQIAVDVSTIFDAGDPCATDPIERIACRPDVQVLCYPAVSLISRNDKLEGWQAWVNGLLGPGADAVKARAYSGECNVREDTPPAFLWGTCDDYLNKYWPPYLAALKKKGISFESHIFSNGPHGLGLALEHPTARAWPSLAAAWLKMQGF